MNDPGQRSSLWSAAHGLLIIALIAVNRDYMVELTVGIGRTIVAVGIALWAIGLLWLLRLSRVEY